MTNKYGWFDEEQFRCFKKKFHKELHWLLLYKDPNTAEEYKHVDFDKYFEGFMRRINGLSSLLFYPPEIVEIMNTLEAAFLETRKPDFNYRLYRKLVLDAHTLVDKIGR